MRCKNCKKEIENPNFLKCPHCGKPIKKRKKRDPQATALSVGFFAVGALFVVLTFFSFSFKCAYYSEAAMIISIVVFMVSLPFIYGNYKGLGAHTPEVLAAVVSLPFIGNWFSVVVFAKESVNFGGLSNIYYISTLAILLLTDILLLLRAAEVLKKPFILSWIALSLGIVAVVFTIIYFSVSGVVKSFAVLIIAAQCLLPSYMAFHALISDHRKNFSK